ncbi:glycosyltransferase family 39 protein [Streptomyces triticisoli]|uniref:glycosyltransferase family 39 protein n=1 Tax=Streptomyces triticisoli TaxID=2182797 RepID=UPI001E56BA35|nr:glycosyltransferase family 39 protein [Streptomyces triticisoli]
MSSDGQPPMPAQPVARRAFVVAVALTAVAAVQQLLIAAGMGGRLPGWQPWPYLLGAAPAWLLARPYWQRADSSVWLKWIGRLRRIPVWAYVLGVLSLATGVWAALQDHEPYIGHEEAVYANKARSWLDGSPDAGWGIYRPFGLPALGRIALALHEDVGSLRVVALLLGLFTLIVTYVIAARWTTPRRAVVVLLLVLSGLGFLRRFPEFLNDIGSTGLLLIVVFLLVHAQEKENSRALLGVPFVVLAAFYLRYGVVANLVAITLAAVLAYGPRAWLARWRHLSFAAVVLFAGLIPHLLHAVQSTGQPLGVMLSATGQANRAYMGDGLVYYLLIFPYRLAGDLGAVIMAVGLFSAWAAFRGACRNRRAGGNRTRVEDRRRMFLGSAAVLIFCVLGLTSHGEPRFVYLPVVLLTILGVQAVAEATGRWSSRVLAAVAALATVTVAGTAQVVAHGAMSGPTDLSRSTVPVAQQLSADGPCLLVTGYEPEMGWYSGCDAVTYAQYREMKRPPEVRTSFVLFERGRLQPGPVELKRLIAGRDTDVRRIPTEGSIGAATVVTVR